MKKTLFLFVSALLILSSSSCRKSLADGESAQVRITICAPAELTTKGIGDGTAAKNLVFAVFDAQGNELPALRQGDWTKGAAEIVFNQTDEQGRPSTTVSATLVKGKAYTFVCWAQNKSAACYDFTDMKAIEVSYDDALAQDEDRDAFYVAQKSGLIKDGYDVTLVLTRPFAQVNVGTGDVQAAYEAGLDVTNLYSTMTLTNVAHKLYTFWGAEPGDDDKDGTADDFKTVTFSLQPSISKATWDETTVKAGHEWLTISKDGYRNQKYGWLAMNYLLVDKAKTSDVTFSLYEGEKYKLSEYQVSAVNMDVNYRTHLLGNLFTSTGQIAVVIEPAFRNDDIVGPAPVPVP